MRKWKGLLALAAGILSVYIAGCGQRGASLPGGVPQISGLSYESSMELTYAEGFEVYYYSEGFKVLDIHDSRQYLVVPEGKTPPQKLPDGMIQLWEKPEQIYLAASSVMALFDSLDGLDAIGFSGTRSSDWYVENAKTAMEAGDIQFAGKYSQPDYELLLDGGCDLAIESTMILHTPKVQELLEDLGIPVLTDYSSYESHPLGRTEWIKLYGALLGKDKQARIFFEEQARVLESLEEFPNTEKTVAFFYVTNAGTVVVRRNDDYIPAMIQIAGGRYVFQDLEGNGTQSTSVTLTMEEFYTAAREADYLIYNASIDDQVNSLEDLLQKSELFSDFRAVKNHRVWCTGKYMYQATDQMGTLIGDIHEMLTDGENEEMTFLYPLT